MSLPDADSVLEANAALITTVEHDAARAFNAYLSSWLQPFPVVPGAVVDTNGIETGPFESLILTPDVTRASSGAYPADSVACAICIVDNIDLQGLQTAYEQLAAVKQLAKTPTSKEAQSTTTLGLVVAARSSISLEALADKMRVVSQKVADGLRPDMVAVLSQGVISYDIRLLGNQQIAGYLPPSRNGFAPPPALLYLTITSTPSHALHNLLFFIRAHLAFYAPTIDLGDARPILVGSPTERTIAATYQFASDGHLAESATIVQVQAPYVIRRADKRTLAKIWFQPWQDGGIVVLEGNLPLLMVLALSGRACSFVTVRNEKGFQLSTVLPIGQSDFEATMREAGKRSHGMTIQRDQAKFTVMQMLDEGTSSPFMARLYLTPLNMRDLILSRLADVKKFDEAFESLLTNLVRVRQKAKVLDALWKEHEQGVTSGRIARVDNAIHIDDPIAPRLNELVNDLVMGAGRSVKHLQKVVKIVACDIGFLFQKQHPYEIGVAKLSQADPDLAAYLRNVRIWSEPLIRLRTTMEHDSYVPPPIKYEETGFGGVRAHEPLILDEPITSYFPKTLSRLNRFVEEVLIWCFQRTLISPIIIAEIPREKRDPHKVERFKISVDSQEARWVIAYSNANCDAV